MLKMITRSMKFKAIEMSPKIMTNESIKNLSKSPTRVNHRSRNGVKKEETGDGDIKKTKKNKLLEESSNSKKKKLKVVKVKEELDDGRIKNAVNLLNGAKFVGAHVSAAGGLENAPINAAAIGAKSFALFLRSQRKWIDKPLSDETVQRFKEKCQKHGFAPQVILPHGSYLLNCGSPKLDVLRKSREALIDELQRCEKLGLTLYNFHPGSTCGEISVEECLDLIGETINLAHSQTKYVITVVENMSRQGHTIGGDFKELKGIVDRIKDKSRIGICLDTCHAFAAGYDLSTEDGFETTMKEFDSVIGLNYLKGLHLNDSKGQLGCHLDRHENIGKGYIKTDGFRRIMHDPRFNHLPMILETPYFGDETYEEEIRLLNSL